MSQFGNNSTERSHWRYADILNSPFKHRALIFVLSVVFLFLIVAKTCLYEIAPDEVAIVTLFGRYLDTKDSGLHFKVPHAHQIMKVRSKRRHKEEFGFRTVRSAGKSEYRRDNEMSKEASMLTGDLNVAVVEWIVHYTISDPEQYVFKVRDAKETLRDLSESVMRSVVGNYSITEVLTQGREEILETAGQRLAALCSEYETGITVQRIELKDSSPPEAVKPAFNEVNQAEQDRDRLVNEAWAVYNSKIPRARGEALQCVHQAVGYAAERENRAIGDAERFSEVEEQYSKAPNVTRVRMYHETVSEVFPKAGQKIVIDDTMESMLLLPKNLNDSYPSMRLDPNNNR